jgi:hypothetical protein
MFRMMQWVSMQGRYGIHLSNQQRPAVFVSREYWFDAWSATPLLCKIRPRTEPICTACPFPSPRSLRS